MIRHCFKKLSFVQLTAFKHRYTSFGLRHVISSKVFRSNYSTQPLPLAKSTPSAPRTHCGSMPTKSIQFRVASETKPIVGWWMMGTSALVFGIVLLGGVTRLTESGLSMVDWSLLGSRPPSSEEEWNSYFEKYKQFPEYKVLNKGMTVDEFKNIYWYEYSHRMMGRFIGLFVAVPGLYFIARGYCSPKIRNRILMISGMVGCQGLLGWYMVKSGLDDKIIENRQVPRVSQYRLASHLACAFVIYMTAFMTGMTILSRGKALSVVIGEKMFGQMKSIQSFKKLSHTVTGMVFFTAVSGAFVAGLDAGLIYNTFPLMADRWIPSDLFAFTPVWTNFFENSTTVQFDHRLLAMTTYFAIFALWLWSKRLPLNKEARFASNVVFGVANMQVLLGISTLLWLVPVPLAAAHQGGSLTLLTCALWLQHALKRMPK